MSLEKFVSVSNNVGESIDFIQGGGGNTSFKIDSQKMLIKASGHLLRDMSVDSGYCTVDFPAIRDVVGSSADLEEGQFTSRIISKTLSDESVRPSIETGFHAVCNDAVIHSHSVYANVLTCSKEGREIAAKLFPESYWVDYAPPGKQITLKIKEQLDSRPHQEEQVIFMKNHGVIVSTPDLAGVHSLHQEINTRIIEELNLDPFKIEGYPREKIDLDFLNSNIIFPDQIVYTLLDQGSEISQPAYETMAAHKYIFDQIKCKNLTPSLLTTNEIQFIKDMENEKYRLSISKNVYSKT